MIGAASARGRRFLAAGLAAAGLLALLLQALGSEPPLSASLAAIRSFWSSGETTRLLNSPAFKADRQLGLALLRADREWPMDREAVLVVPSSLDVWAAQRTFEKAAFVLAPRRVTMRRDGTGPAIRLMLAPRR
jgi:hypothetical protein